MVRTSLLGAAAASVIALHPVAGQAQSQADAAAYLQNTLRAYSVLVLRSLVDFTYESFSYDALTGLVATGVKVYPPLDWIEGEEECEISIGRLAITGDVASEALAQTIEFTDLVVPPICLEEEPRGFLAQIGYEGITAETAVIEIGYELPSSAAELSMQATLADAATLNLVAEFSYFWFAGIIEDDPYPVIHLTRAEVSLENDGAWERVEDMVGGMIGSVDALPDMATGGLTSELTRGGTREMSPAEAAFVSSLGDALRTFLTDRRRLTVTVAPEGGVWLNEEVFDDPDTMLMALQPMVSNGPHSVVTILSPALLSSALNDAAGLSAEDRLTAGRALMTGIGAPRNRAVALDLLVPLAAQDWDAEAAAILAQGLVDSGELEAAYPYALVALAGGEAEALGLTAEIEAALSAEFVVETQSVILSNHPEDPDLAGRRDEALKLADVATMRRLALDARMGRGVPRSYATAYLWASLAAAAGDRVSASLRDDLDAMAAGEPAWAEAFAEAATEAMELWTEGGLANAMNMAGR